VKSIFQEELVQIVQIFNFDFCSHWLVIKSDKILYTIFDNSERKIFSEKFAESEENEEIPIFISFTEN
jgi:hypothetical protein